MNFRSSYFADNTLCNYDWMVHSWQCHGFDDCKENTVITKCKQSTCVKFSHLRYYLINCLHTLQIPFSTHTKMGPPRSNVQIMSIHRKCLYKFTSINFGIDCPWKVCEIIRMSFNFTNLSHLKIVMIECYFHKFNLIQSYLTPTINWFEIDREHHQN